MKGPRRLRRRGKLPSRIRGESKEEGGESTVNRSFGGEEEFENGGRGEIERLSGARA